MKTFLHVLNTWLISVLITLMIAFGYEVLINNPSDFKGLPNPTLLLILFYCLLAATPSFLISWAFLVLIKPTSYSIYEKLLLWFLTVFLSVVLNIFIAVLVIAPEIISLGIFFFFWPVYVSIVVTIILRLKQFLLLINKTPKHETNMV